MTAQEKPLSVGEHEISVGDLLGLLDAQRSKRLIFNYEGRDVSPGYHVTEIKAGMFQALDCGANFEQWPETFIQLWDIPPEDDRGFLPVAKFLAIVGKVATAISLQRDAKLTFEVSDGVRAMQLYRASQVDVGGDAVRVSLTKRPSSCKPRDRWLEQSPQPCCA